MKRLILFLLPIVLLAQPTPKENLQRAIGTNTITGSNLGAPLQVQTIAALRDVTVANVSDGQQVNVVCYATAGDGGGGLFYYSSGSASADNGGTIIAPNSGGGRWIRLYSGPLNVRWFGAYGDTVPSYSVSGLTNVGASFTNASGGTAHDDSSAIQAALDYAASLNPPGGAYVYFPEGGYYLGTTLSLTNSHRNLNISGSGYNTIMYAQAPLNPGIQLYGALYCHFADFQIKSAHTSLDINDGTEASCAIAIIRDRTDYGSSGHIFDNIIASGAFSKSALVKMSSELITFNKCQFVNYDIDGAVWNPEDKIADRLPKKYRSAVIDTSANEAGFSLASGTTATSYAGGNTVTAYTDCVFGAGGIYRSVACTASDSANNLTATDHLLVNGTPVRPTANFGGLSTGTTYFVVNRTANTFQVSTTRGGSAFNITADGAVTLRTYDVTTSWITLGGNWGTLNSMDNSSFLRPFYSAFGGKSIFSVIGALRGLNISGGSSETKGAYGLYVYKRQRYSAVDESIDEWDINDFNSVDNGTLFYSTIETLFERPIYTQDGGWASNVRFDGDFGGNLNLTTDYPGTIGTAFIAADNGWFNRVSFDALFGTIQARYFSQSNYTERVSLTPLGGYSGFRMNLTPQTFGGFPNIAGSKIRPLSTDQWFRVGAWSIAPEIGSQPLASVNLSVDYYQSTLPGWSRQVFNIALPYANQVPSVVSMPAFQYSTAGILEIMVGTSDTTSTLAEVWVKLKGNYTADNTVVSSVDVTDNLLHVPDISVWKIGERIDDMSSTGSIPTGLSAATFYWVSAIVGDGIRLKDASGATVGISGAGSGVLTIKRNASYCNVYCSEPTRLLTTDEFAVEITCETIGTSGQTYTGGVPDMGSGVATLSLSANRLQSSGGFQTPGNTKTASLNISAIAEYADNAAALAGGLVAGDCYRTGDSLKIVH